MTKAAKRMVVICALFVAFALGMVFQGQTQQRPAAAAPDTFSHWAHAGSSLFTDLGITGVGIGTATPLNPLHISGDEVVAGVNRASIRLQHIGASQRWTLNVFGTGAAEGGGKFGINQVGSGNRLVIDTTGNVGVGTTSPTEQLEIMGNFRLPVTTAATGVIKSGGNRFIHNFGLENFFAGVNAGNLTMTGIQYTGVGVNALAANTTGNSNTATGRNALAANTTGFNNTATGVVALFNNTTGVANTATEEGALGANTEGGSNMVTGVVALFSNTEGFNNTAIGLSALVSNTTGSFNTAIGSSANVSAGNLTNATAIGSGAIVNASNKIRLGSAFVNVVEAPVALSTPSDARLKTNIEQLSNVLEKLQQIRGVSYERVEPGESGDISRARRRIGVIAQEVEAVFPELVTTSGKEGYKAVTYATLTAVLIEAVKELKAENEELRGRVEALERAAGVSGGS
jgi:hypothetical protein